VAPAYTTYPVESCESAPKPFLVRLYHWGQVLAACRLYIEHVQVPELAEVYRHAPCSELAEDAGFQNVIMASDCASLISKVFEN
jgi:hypothetical protein